jgi:hypothetical protein
MKIKPFHLDENKRLNKINNTIKEPFPKLNQHLLMCAPTNSGKSTIMGNLLLGPLKFKFDKVIFFSSTWDYDLYKKIIQIDKENIHQEYTDYKLQEILDEKKSLEEELNKPLFYLIIFDDMQEQFYKGSFLENFLCKCRHYGITLYVLAQYAYAISKKSRQQFSAFICFPMLSNEEDIDIISETAPGGKRDFKQAINYIKSNSENVRDFLFINKNLKNKYWFNFEYPIE